MDADEFNQKLDQIEEQAQLTLAEFPKTLTKERQRMIIALVRYIRAEAERRALSPRGTPKARQGRGCAASKRVIPSTASELKAKLQQIEEQLQFAMKEYPERIALERLKFALALTKFIRHQIDLDATVEQSIPAPYAGTRSTSQ